MIDGERRTSADGSFRTIDPASNTTLAEVAKGTPQDVNDAVSSSRDALRVWRRTKPVERARILDGISKAVLAHSEELARLESLDTGKPLTQARADVTVAARYFEYYAGLADKLVGLSIPLGDDFLDYTLREPIGVSAQIVAWNYPMQIGCRGIAPALASGSTVVVKPASEAPLSILRLAELALDAGLPRGVMNVVTGPGATVGMGLASHPGINQITFTGSVDVGAVVMGAAAKNCVPVVLELGGKSPNVVFADADLDLASPIIAKAILQNAGQTCSAGSRLLVQHEIADELLERVEKLLSSATIAPGLEDPDIGPLISKRQLDLVQGHVDQAKRDGVEIITGGSESAEASERYGGFFYSPTLALAKPDAAIVREEVFGPVLAATTFADEDEAIGFANATDYGLVAGVWTKDIVRAHTVAREIESGQVYINGYGAGGGVELPFGGYKKSGFGREKSLEGIGSYLQTKNVCVRLT